MYMAAVGSAPKVAFFPSRKKKNDEKMKKKKIKREGDGKN